MSKPPPATLKLVSPKIHALLAKLRRSIRRHILLDGVAGILIWLTIACWIFLAIDYGPVRFGFNETSRQARIVFLAVGALGLSWTLFYLVLRRVFVPLKNESLAMLVERAYPEFEESLVTTVSEPTKRSNEHDPLEMRCHTRLVAEALLPGVDVRKIIDRRPLNRKLAVAGLMCVSGVMFLVANPAVARLAAQRLFWLDETSWPRACQIELVGIRILREKPIEGISELGQMLVLNDGLVKVARGSSFTLLARAEGPGNEPESGDGRFRKLPENCVIFYEGDQATKGSITMNRIGAPRDGYQLFSFDGPPFNGVLSDLRFQIRGGDHRIGPFKIEIVDEPSVIATTLYCQYPEYMVDRDSGRWTPRENQWTGKTELPIGTNVTVRARANKPLRKVYSYDVSQREMNEFPVEGTSFEISIPVLSQSFNRELFLLDIDGMVAEQPFNIVIEPVLDQPPTIQSRLEGIGTAVTPAVRIPIRGTIQDDYGIGAAWLKIETDQDVSLIEPIEYSAQGAIAAEIDFLEKQRAVASPFELSTGDGNTLALTVKANDRCDLLEKPNTGSGDRYVLDVVTAQQLTRMLERSEVAQRRRLEQIFLEVSEARGYLVRTAPGISRLKYQLEPGESLAETGEPVETGEESRRLEVRMLFAQRALNQIDKSTREISGVVDAFENIRLQLINNRIDAEDRKTRIEVQIVAPLNAVVQDSIPSLRTQVEGLESALRQWQATSPGGELTGESGSIEQQAVAAIDQIDIVLGQLSSVLDALMKYETQNELLEIVRQMIQRQQEIMEQTKKERQRKAFEGLLD